jgi:SAM-dependent methyltransferase
MLADAQPPAVLETVACDLCGAVDAVPFRRTRDHLSGTPGDWQFVRCATCGLIYLNPRPTPAHIGAYYPDLDYHAFAPERGIKAHVIAWLRDREASALLRDAPGGVQVLEVGCGTGDLLARLHRRGASVVGVEPNPAAAEVARRQHGLDVATGTLDEVALPEGTFDLALMRYALEHVHRPLATLRRLAAMLRPGGRAVLWVPNADSFDAQWFGHTWRGLDAPRHLYLFTPATLGHLIATAGLRVERVAYSGVPNDWAGSLESHLAQTHPRLARWVGLRNPLALAAWLPISAAAAAVRKAGRLRVVARKP